MMAAGEYTAQINVIDEAGKQFRVSAQHDHRVAVRESGKLTVMKTARYIHWQDQGMWLGYLEEYPDYLTQGETVEELEKNLRDLDLPYKPDHHRY